MIKSVVHLKSLQYFASYAEQQIKQTNDHLFFYRENSRKLEESAIGVYSICYILIIIIVSL